MFYYGSKPWANSLLRIAIADCRDLARESSSCNLEILYIKRILIRNGFVWQATILGYHYNLRLRNLKVLQREAVRPRADPVKAEIGGLS